MFSRQYFDQEQGEALEERVPRGTQVVATAVGLSPGDATFYLRRTNYAPQRNDVQITFSPTRKTAYRSISVKDTNWTRPLPPVERPW